MVQGKLRTYCEVKTMHSYDTIYGINGPVVTINGRTQLSMMEMVYVGNKKLVGEVIGLDDEKTTIQVYEETTSLKPGEPVYPTGAPMSLTLGPGIIRNIFDGIQRPLSAMEKASGAFIDKGTSVTPIDFEKEWDVEIDVKIGDELCGGDIYAHCEETPVITHKMMVPPYLSGTVTKCMTDGKYKAGDCIVEITDKKGNVHQLTLCQKWPIRTPRPTKNRLGANRPLITGQRIIDTLFPIAKGGAAAIPGGFGTGKTMTQHQLAKWCDADIIIYVGCGERGNEMTQALVEFGEIIDPKTGKPLTDRTILIANTSNMPVAAREASIYTGITLAEYYRDMGYHTALMADSTSRWAEALREISGRLEEMPADEGFPAYLPSRLSEFYERAGYTENLNGTEGSITLIGAVSPQGSDFSEPVTQNTKRFTRCFWALDKALAYSRHYPAINWNDSYSEYLSDLKDWYDENVATDFLKLREEFCSILLEENSLLEIANLVGTDVLPDEQKLTMEIARVIRVGFLQQNAFHKEDTFVPLEKQYKMMQVILHLYHKAQSIIARQVPISKILSTGIFDKLVKIKYDVPNAQLNLLDGYIKEIDEKLNLFLV